MLCDLVEVTHNLFHGCWKEKYNVSLFVRSHEWIRMSTQYKSVKNKRVALRRMVGGIMNASNGSNVFSSMLIEFSLMRVGDFPLRDDSSLNIGRVQRWVVSPSLGEVRQEKYAKKKKEFRKEREESEVEKEIEKEIEKMSCKVESRVGAPSWGPCFLLILLIHRFLSYMAVCLTNLMVFFPLPESWMAVTPATLAIFWSQYGNGNRQP